MTLIGTPVPNLLKGDHPTQDLSRFFWEPRLTGFDQDRSHHPHNDLLDSSPRSTRAALTVSTQLG